MRKMKRVVAMMLSLMLCLGMMFISVSAAPDYTDGYLNITDANGEWFDGYYDLNTTFDYHLELYIYDGDQEDYVVHTIEKDAVITVYLYDAENDADLSELATGTGDHISWTATTGGEVNVHVVLEQNGYTYEGYELYWIGKPIDLVSGAYLMYNGPAGNDGFLYTGKSIKKDIFVIDTFTGNILAEGVDYRISLTNPKNVGNGVVTVTGIGNYSGTLREEYTIYDHTYKFTDIKRSGWYVGAINFALDQGLFAGTSTKTFSPDGEMTRAMFVTVIGRMLGWQELPEVGSSFKDVKAGQYYTKYVAYAYATGIVGGMSADYFAPNDRITREQMCAILVRVNNFIDAGLEETMETEVPLEMVAGGTKFVDHKQISAYAKDAVYSCRNAGIVSGRPGNLFDPKGNATRAEVATILMGYYRYVGTVLAGEM